MTECEANYDFPVERFIDKAACNQDKFLEKFPQNDGRGILIAIIDSGVDPDLPSMKITTTGERKLVDLIDCSGENDVDTSVVRTATNGVVEGITGRKLKVISIVRPMNTISQYYGDLMEALNICIQMKVDIINFSIWIRFDIEHYGKLLTELSDIAYKHNIVVVKSGGNFRPCLSTVDTVTALGATISVSACMTKSLKETVYSSLSSNDGYMCDYSARGPSLSGALALSVSAPGSALAAISRHELSSCKVKKGTSMSSPYVAGVVACLLSGLRSQNRQWNPYQIKRALENTAKTDSDHFCKLSNGQGLVQICEAYDYLTSTIINKPLNQVVTFVTSVENESNNDTESIMRTEGIYIRTKLEQKIAQHRIAVVAEFQQTDEGKLHQLQFEQKLRLVSDRDWIKAPDHFFLAGTKSSFDAKIDYSAVPKGDVVYSEIVGLDTDNAELGPLFRVPITVINPIEVTEETKYKYVFTALISPVVPYRKFVEVPSHANIMVLNVSTDSLPVGDKLKIRYTWFK